MFNYKQEQAIIVTATPEIVDWLLSLNTKNREIKKPHIRTLKSNLAHWMLTNQGIGVSTDGVLIDGQHRLIMLKESGYPPVKILLVLGLDPKAQAVIDTHAKRSLIDITRLLLDEKIQKAICSALNNRIRIKNDGVKFTMDCTATKTADVFQLADMLLAEKEMILRVFHACGWKQRAGVMAAFLDYAKKYSIEKACELGIQVKDGVGLQKNDPAFKLRAYLSGIKSGGQAMLVENYAITAYVCIAHARNEKISRLRASSSWDRLPPPAV